jgi:hypothetical protein
MSSNVTRTPELRLAARALGQSTGHGKSSAMTAEYEITKDDLIAFNLYHHRHSPTTRRQYLRSWFVPAFMWLLVCTGIWYWAGRERGTPLRSTERRRRSSVLRTNAEKGVLPTTRRAVGRDGLSGPRERGTTNPRDLRHDKLNALRQRDPARRVVIRRPGSRLDGTAQ